MNREEAKRRMAELTELLEYHGDKYFNQDAPEITDREFDELSVELRKLEAEFPNLARKDSPTRKVGGRAKREAGVLVRHRVPMLSIQDVFSREEVEHWVTDMRKKLGEDTEFLVETKIDGLSLALRYTQILRLPVFLIFLILFFQNKLTQNRKRQMYGITFQFFCDSPECMQNTWNLIFCTDCHHFLRQFLIFFF